MVRTGTIPFSSKGSFRLQLGAHHAYGRQMDRYDKMIPHHSLAITRAERSELDDVPVCQLAVEIREAQ